MKRVHRTILLLIAALALATLTFAILQFSGARRQTLKAPSLTPLPR
jgi:hypothetical protein